MTFASTMTPVFLAFFHTRVSGQQVLGLQGLAQVRIELKERTRNAMGNGTHLACNATADHASVMAAKLIVRFAVQ